jgi:hypothetical protein
MSILYSLRLCRRSIQRTEQNQITLFGMHPWTTLKRLLATHYSLTFKKKARYEVPDFLLETQNLRTNAKNYQSTLLLHKNFILVLKKTYKVKLLNTILQMELNL